MFSILDMPQFTTLEQAREAVRFGGINLDELVQYLRAGNKADRLAQADYYPKMTWRVRRDVVVATSLCGAIIVVIIVLALVAPRFIL